MIHDIIERTAMIDIFIGRGIGICCGNIGKAHEIATIAQIGSRKIVPCDGIIVIKIFCEVLTLFGGIDVAIMVILVPSGSDLKAEILCDNMRFGVTDTFACIDMAIERKFFIFGRIP